MIASSPPQRISAVPAAIWYSNPIHRSSCFFLLKNGYMHCAHISLQLGLFFVSFAGTYVRKIILKHMSQERF